MSSMSEDIQCAGFDTRPPMLDRTDFESWQQRIRLYCLGKDNGENIMKSITEGPFQMGTMRDTLTEGGEGALHLGPERARVFADLSAEQKDRYKADIRATNILLQGIPKDIYTLINHFTDAKDIWDNVKMILEGSELTKDDQESQLYDEFEHFCQIKGETIHVYYVRFTKLINDMRNIKMTMPRMQLNSKFVNNMLPEWSRFITEVKLNRVSNASVQQYSTQSSKSPQSSNEPSPADNFQLDLGSSSTENLIESFIQPPPSSHNRTNHIFLKQHQLKRHLNARNKATRNNQEEMCICKDRRTKQRRHYVNPGFRLQSSDIMLLMPSPGELVSTGKKNNPLFSCRRTGTNFDDDMDDSPEDDLTLNVDHVFEADQCDAFDSDVDEAPTTQTMFMVNLSSEDPIYDEAWPSYDSILPFEVQDHDTL
ncbi:hypothetical protein Tco_0317711 [Tanacetum coccineum]